MNIAAITGPVTRPLKPNIAMPPSVEIRTTYSALGSRITKYLTRASVAVPFVVALGFRRR